MIRIITEPYSALSASSPDSHSSLSPTICCCAGFFHLLTALNHAGVSTHFGYVGFLGFQAPGGSARHFSSHSARFWACFATLSAVAFFFFFFFFFFFIVFLLISKLICLSTLFNCVQISNHYY